MQEMQSVQLELLKVCRDICQRYGLMYFLFGDTLRGAFRKGGFLPDSMEAALLMPAADLKNFCAYFEREKPAGLFLSNIETEAACPHVHVKIRKDGTTAVPASLKEMPLHHGIGIDLYPYYPVDVGKAARVLTKLNLWVAERLLGASCVPYTEKPSFLNKLLVKIPAEKRRSLAIAAIKRLEKGNRKSMQVCTPFGGAAFFWREALGEEETFSLTLEGESFRVPDKREVFLNMSGPAPAEDVIVNCKKGYANCRGEKEQKSKK